MSMSSIKDSLHHAVESLHVSGGSGGQKGPQGESWERAWGNNRSSLHLHFTDRDYAVYVDEAKGSDTTGKGTKEAPYATTVGAMLALGSEISLFVKKSGAEGDKEEGGADADGYAPISGAGLKRAKKGLEAAQKKKKKQEEASSKTQDAEETDAKKLEESKSVVLEEPKGDYQKVR